MELDVIVHETGDLPALGVIPDCGDDENGAHLTREDSGGPRNGSQEHPEAHRMC